MLLDPLGPSPVYITLMHRILCDVSVDGIDNQFCLDAVAPERVIKVVGIGNRNGRVTLIAQHQRRGLDLVGPGTLAWVNPQGAMSGRRSPPTLTPDTDRRVILFVLTFVGVALQA